ncbi:hypothetical protein DOM21_12030 [Bacteriovorax stolpii]|uniref:Uncharacterized protein n=1 Tax=Bacteriovorax stolpii TaxID=960 RepID=A0A2K9NSY5_BACTC|nr:hypothetical protein [Bacteriovorax stolpii]AUN97854.1 hypothetical protein C0V70_06970 [Bacteriovorax stolpii]QDK42160.1 hypothetical protein DOM21_12030 [Bacteriovorax stolpii]TDP51682.1 hypothetical protein C8D79_3126 [Bacteriovorax stolpii]
MNKLLVAVIAFIPALSFAAAVQFGRIVDIKGAGFISYNGETHEIKKGEVIYANSEIVVEHTGQVTFTDNADHRFFMGSATSVAVSPNNVELRSGDLWVQSLNKMDDAKLTSANATVNYQGGEAIFSYDSAKGKTQLMVINGLMKFSNLRQPALNLTVAEGNFSFVDQDFEEGMPRDPTPVGAKTYGELVSLFPGVGPMDKKSAEIFKGQEEGHTALTKRTIASVPEHHGAESHGKKEAAELEKEYKAEIMNMKKPAHEVVTAPVKKEAKSKPVASTPVANKLVVKIYGLQGSETSATTAIYDIPSVDKNVVTSKRAPASVPESVSETVVDQAVPAENMNTIPTTPHYKESDKLIDQLNKL